VRSVPLSRSRPLPVLAADPRSTSSRSQGYAFKVITSLDGLEQLDNLVYPTRAEQIELLQSVLLASETDADRAAAAGEDEGMGGKDVGGFMGTPAPFGRRDGAPQATRIAGNLQALSGCVFRSPPSSSLVLHLSISFCALVADILPYLARSRARSGQSMAYSERQKSANKQLAKDSKSQRNALFRKRDEEKKRRAKEKAAG